jgi:hypothetical protein
MEKVKVLKLRPPQFSIGLKEVEAKVEKIGKLNKEELREYLSKHEVPVVISPEGHFYLVDHHHLARAAWELNIEEIQSEIFEDLSHLPTLKFWEQMIEKKWVYLRDQFGLGPHSYEDLPWDVRGLADDPFRSLAWMVREKKGFEKTKTPFSEFAWANFFRKNIVKNPSLFGYPEALQLALKWCSSEEAKDLPGFVG